MLDVMDHDIDAVMIATPDHTHAVIAMECMRRGKHVYMQKPLARTIYETRQLIEAAREYKVMTQMGNLALYRPGEKILWDGEAMKVTNRDDMDQYINPSYREGWAL